MLANSYKQYLYLSRPVSRKHPMDVGHRAKQFASFAALRGLEETLQKQEIIYEFQKELSEEKKNELDIKLRTLKYGMRIQVTFFERARKDKAIGQYHTVAGKVEFFDPSIYLRVDDTEIQIQDICGLSGEMFEALELPC